MVNHYDVLGVSKNATPTEIKKAYKRKARETHPDVNPSPTAKEDFVKVQNSYEVLSDPVKKSKYDSSFAQTEKPEEPRKKYKQQKARAGYRYKTREQTYRPWSDYGRYEDQSNNKVFQEMKRVLDEIKQHPYVDSSLKAMFNEMFTDKMYASYNEQQAFIDQMKQVLALHGEYETKKAKKPEKQWWQKTAEDEIEELLEELMESRHLTMLEKIHYKKLAEDIIQNKSRDRIKLFCGQLKTLVHGLRRW